MRKNITVIVLLLLSIIYPAHSQQDSIVAIGSIHSNLYFNTVSQSAFILADSTPAYEVFIPSRYTLDKVMAEIKGTTTGLFFDFGDEHFTGKLVYGFIPYGDSKHPHPVYFRTPADIVQGRTTINISQVLSGRYDMIGWAEKGYGTMGYRIIDSDGQLIYDGKVSFQGKGPFEVVPTLIEGPFVNLLTPTSATISFETSKEIEAEVFINGKTFKTRNPSTHHEIQVKGLTEDTDYDYEVKYGSRSEKYSLHTASEPGSRKAFSFAFTSDSRSGNGGGERDMYGTNFYIMKKIMALAKYKGVRFAQFSGDMINGYLTEKGAMDLQYANWKRAVEPFAHYFPVYMSIGNHEVLMRIFRGDNTTYMIDRFPYDTESAEAVFGNHFVNPENGPVSEDGAKYDPDPTKSDFPSYKENVFYYTYDNVAMVVLNSNYWFAPSRNEIPHTGGSNYGYIMDNQLKWIRKTLKSFEKDKNIDHVFITLHTPVFPNGGHVADGMWYYGKNDFRPYVAGEPMESGIIERRDELLEIVVNESTKVVAILTGHEHNYYRTEVGPETNIYPDNWDLNKLTLSRTIYQINNGAAGAPYYAQEQTPWTPFTSNFTTQNALVFFHIKGENVEMEVLNPDTLEEVDTYKLR